MPLFLYGRWHIVAAVGVALAVAAVLLGAVVEQDSTPVAYPGAPNIVVIMTDDQNVGTINAKTMPATTRLLKDRGLEFGNNVVSTPQCCPSRAAFFTGQYGHNNGVLSNGDGYPSLIWPQSMLPSWLQQAGYRTAYIGRFLHHYGETVPDAAQPAPGWDAWAAITGVRYFDYTVSYNGIPSHYGRQPRDYSTTVFTRAAVELVNLLAPKPAPMFMNVAYVAPHKERRHANDGYCGGAIAPAPRDRHLFRNAPLPSRASIGEKNLSDKPTFIQSGTHLNDRYAKTLKAYRCGLAALREVDRGVARIVAAFRQAGELNNTVFIFTSDNGRFEGEHGLPGGKSFPYEQAIDVPLIIRAPRSITGPDPPSQTDALTANIDLAPTILDLAHAQPCLDGWCRMPDGRSLMPLIGGAGGWPGRRAVLIQLREPASDVEARLPCAYQGVRTRRDFYVRYTSVRDPGSGGCVRADVSEYYNLARDPQELRNLAANPQYANRQRHLARVTTSLSHCSGIRGARPPSDVPFCR